MIVALYAAKNNQSDTRDTKDRCVDAQPPQGISTKTRQEDGLQGVEIAYGVAGDLGPQKRDEVVYCTSEKDFWTTFMASINIGGVQVQLSREGYSALARSAMRKLLGKDDEYVRMEKLMAWSRRAMTPEQLVALAHKMKALK